MNMSPRAIIEDFYKRYHRRTGVIDVHQEGRTIIMFVDGSKFNTSMTDSFWGLPVRIYDVRALLDDSVKMLHRIRDENIDLENPNNKQFWDIFAVGATIWPIFLVSKRRSKEAVMFKS